MTIYNSIITALWFVLIAYWLVSAIGVKRTVGGRQARRDIGLRVGAVIFILLAIRIARSSGLIMPYAGHNSTLQGVVGVAICAVGVAFAIWARAYLGRNWGMPMSRKENPELVTGGPYAFVRHPIYTGVLVAAIGSMIANSRFWLVPLILWGAYFVYSARREERFMTEQFPEQYPAYMARTRMLLPFIL